MALGKRFSREAVNVFCVVTEEKKQYDETRLDPVGSTVRYEMMKLCTGSV